MGALLETVSSPEALKALPEDTLPELCEEIRQEIISICGKVGGHLGASLGAVEIIVALHRVFRSPKDQIVFDVGHQAYAHKILTGRREQMATLRQEDGIAPFPDPQESPHDAFLAGHSCTAVSAALGLLVGLSARGHDGHVVAVVGDGSLTGGLTFEGLNNVGYSSRPLFIVLNDNEMSISANVGAVSSLLRSVQARQFFESLGLTYVGPLDGHDVRALVSTFSAVKSSTRPVVVHVRTTKGKGLKDAEMDMQTRGHAMGPFEFRDGKLVRSRGGQLTFSEAFAQALEQKMASDERVVVVTPAMLEGSSLTGLQQRYPQRVFDVGIAEQHAVTFCAGLAKQGLRPVCCLYSTFLQRAFDQVVHDVVLPKLPVVFAIDRAGLVGADGATHQGAFDLSILRPLPGLTLMAPVVGEDLPAMLDVSLAFNGPSAIRFPRGTLESWPCDIKAASFPVSGARWLKRAASSSLTLIGLGPLNLTLLQAANSEPTWSVLDARVVVPLDEAKILEAAEDGVLLVVEEGTTHGGLGSAVLEMLAKHQRTPRVKLLGLPDAFVRHGNARTQRQRLGLDAEGLAREARSWLEGR